MFPVDILPKARMGNVKFVMRIQGGDDAIYGQGVAFDERCGSFSVGVG
jgi:hypothetical protein